MRLRPWLAAAVLGCAVLCVPRAGEPPLPYGVSIGAAYGEPLGPESVRDEMEQELIARLRDAECFLGVEAAGTESAAGADLVVEVILDGFERSTRYDVSIATQHREDGDPASKQQFTAVVEAFLYVQVRRAEDRALVKMDRWGISASRRAAPGVDPSAEATTGLIDLAVRKTRSFLCKASSKKWEKQVREARPAAPAD